MTVGTRRLAAASLAAGLALTGAAVFSGSAPAADRAARVKAEAQPLADRGNGTYLNPILPGVYPDPSVVRVGSDYYLTNTPGTAVPGLLVWHSRDLVNWRPLGPALTKAVGDVWAPDIGYWKDEFFIYFPALVTDPDGKKRRTNFVITAKDAAGPWSDPIDLRVGGIDPGHVADEAGRRYLYLSDGMMVRLSPDGRRVEGAPVKLYDGWPIPREWNIECMCLESPKLFKRGKFFYLISAQGGTAGPSTSHMIVVARAETPSGPWTNMPGNPLLRTKSRAERWWSQGHGTILEAADGKWWMLYHGYENGFRTLGRSTLLLPVEWTPDGWPRVPTGVDPGGAIRKPTGENVGHGFPLSDPFTAAGLGLPWRRWDASESPDDFQAGGGALRMKARGKSPAEAAILTVMALNHSYETQVEMEAPSSTEAGLLLFYDGQAFGGIGIKDGTATSYLRARPWETLPAPVGRVYLKIRNTAHDVELFIGSDGRTWTKLEGGLEMSGYHHETFRTWGTLKIALFAAGEGTVVFRDFRYLGLK
ncbi:MAG: family 43 glycosylhydrolase [Candidatus Aminicenantes bacterium]|nr:family 43 glycosylhydrolase [Candidatus Aminicenantes bacterium]